jgi:hypothetical protein
MTRGTTDLPLRAITFTTPGVNHFMDSVIGIDTQDFLSKMEGFAIQGIQGTVFPLLLHSQVNFYLY